MATLKEVIIPERKGLDAYTEFAGDRIGYLKERAEALRPLSILHINATPLGGGVAEMLGSQVWLERDLGLNSHWFTVNASPPFFAVTKKIHNLLQGRPGVLEEREWDLYRSVNRELIHALDDIIPDESAIVVVHDPQPAPLTEHRGGRTPTLLRMHIDLSTPNATALELLKPYLQAAGRVILSSEAYTTAMPWLDKERIAISYPAIDPFTEKNVPMKERQAWIILESFGVSPAKPLISQISRFDPWKDPLGVIKAYYLAKKDVPDLQLLMVGFIVAQDDPEAISVFEEVQRHALGDPDIHVFADPTRLRDISNDLFVSAAYTASMAVLQKSVREGFGLTITEAMWKSRPVIVGETVGTTIQVDDGENGIVVSSPEEAAEAIVRLHSDPGLREKMGTVGRATVTERFLMPRLIEDFLGLYEAVR